MLQQLSPCWDVAMTTFLTWYPLPVLNTIKPKVCHCSCPASFFAGFTLSVLGVCCLPELWQERTKWWGRALGPGSSGVVKFSQIFTYIWTFCLVHSDGANSVCQSLLSKAPAPYRSCSSTLINIGTILISSLKFHVSRYCKANKNTCISITWFLHSMCVGKVLSLLLCFWNILMLLWGQETLLTSQGRIFTGTEGSLWVTISIVLFQF